MEENDIKEKITRGARDLFIKYGIRSVSMDDVARHLSMSKKTLYQYFSDKDELVLMITEHQLSHDQQKYDGMAKVSENAIDELVRISVCLKQDFQKIHPGLLYDLKKYHAKAWDSWMQHKQKHIHASIVRNLRQGIEEGFFRPEIHPEILATTRQELIQLTFDENIFPADKYNLAEVNLQLFEHFVYGLLTEKGRKAYEKYKQKAPVTELTPSV